MIQLFLAKGWFDGRTVIVLEDPSGKLVEVFAALSHCCFALILASVLRAVATTFQLLQHLSPHSFLLAPSS